MTESGAFLGIAGLSRAAWLSKDEIREELRLAEVCAELGIALDRNDKALCPLHEDHHPSFAIYLDDAMIERWACPVCGLSGDCFALVQAVENVDFGDAVARCRAMLDTPNRAVTRPAAKPPWNALDQLTGLRMTRVRASVNNGWLAVSMGLLHETEPPATREAYDKHLRDEWRVGVGPQGEAVLPHFDVNGALTGIKYRGLDGTKWTEPSSSFPALYGSWRQRRWWTVLICEGETDALWASLQHPRADVLAVPSGAGRLEREWTDLLADVYVLAFDGDDAGHQATAQWRNRLRHRNVHVLPVPDGQDLRTWHPDLATMLQ